jgi:hypothetical protein
MAIPAFTYAPPAVTVIANGPLNTLQGTSPLKTILMIGTAPQGPDYPTLCNASDALTLFGSPSNYQSVGYDLPLAIRLASIQRQPSANAGVSFLVCRAGVTRASITAATVSGTAFTIQGIGAYAGSKGNNLAYNVQVTSGVVTAITVYDVTISGSPILKQQYLGTSYNLTTSQNIANAINGANPLNSPNSIIQVSAVGVGVPVTTVVGSTGAVLISSGLYAQKLSGGSDGLGTTSSDTSIAFLLNQSLSYAVDYIYAGWDYTTIAPTISNHISAALLQNQFRKAVLGPAAGTTFGTMSGGSYTTANSSDRIVCIGHDSFYINNPITGGQTIVDGFYAAAAFAGLKATGPTQETCTKFPISGFRGVAIPSDLVTTTNYLTQANLNLLAQQGLLVFEQTLNDNLLRIRDAITTAPYAFTGGSSGVNGGINVFSQFSARDIDDAWSNAMVQALTPMLGRVFPSKSLLQQAFTLACTSRAAALGSTIVDYAISVALDPATNQPMVTGNYTMPYPALMIQIPTAFTIA